MKRAIGFWIAAVLCGTAAQAQAAGGALDTSFGSGGFTSIHLRNNPSLPTDSLLQPDGKIVVTAALNNTPAATQAFGLIRLLPNGAPDMAFGQRGTAMTNFTNFINSPAALALQPDGKIVVVGAASSADGTLSEFAIARFMPNGTLDATFGQGGKVTTNFVGVMAGGVSNPASAVLLLPNGQLLVAGLASQCAHCAHLTALARYNADGSLDAGFGSAGMVAVDAIQAPNALGVLSNGDIVALAGNLIAEFSPAGAPVNVHSTTQGATLLAASSSGTTLFAPNGQFFQAQAAQGPLGEDDIDVRVKRFDPLATVDPTFASPVFDFAGAPNSAQSEEAMAQALQSDGKVVVAGESVPATGSVAFGLARLNADGTLDPSFGASGTVTTFVVPNRPGNFSFASSLLVQADGKIVAIGLAGNRQGNTFLAAARYLGQ